MPRRRLRINSRDPLSQNGSVALHYGLGAWWAAGSMLRPFVRVSAASYRWWLCEQTIFRLKAMPDERLADLGIQRPEIREAVYMVERGVDPRRPVQTASRPDSDSLDSELK